MARRTRAQIELEQQLISKELEMSKENPLTQNERDWIALKRLLADAEHGQGGTRRGSIGTLTRAIKRLEKDFNDEERRRLLGSDRRESDSEHRTTGKEKEKTEAKQNE